tara:strand:- start:90 stop:446 length:357 start_codon:yes stop_codon:yes gene_type:complete|eukprot:GHVR01122541.1.p1 GENE.GHVR01122541.1~~GHVR01122541.1.p1  ORF type:complete len:119 (-),score=25.32 GHVR01122541.1:258-614(-)
MKIQLKRSNVLDGGLAKAPTDAQMEYGELAVNYSSIDPSVFIKDSSNNVIKIAGEGSIGGQWSTDNSGNIYPTIIANNVLFGGVTSSAPASINSAGFITGSTIRATTKFDLEALPALP